MQVAVGGVLLAMREAVHPASLVNPAAVSAAAAQTARPGAAEGTASAGKWTQKPGGKQEEQDVQPDHDLDGRPAHQGAAADYEDAPGPQPTVPHWNQAGTVTVLSGETITERIDGPDGTARTARGQSGQGSKTTGAHVFGSTDARTWGLDPSKGANHGGLDRLPKGETTMHQETQNKVCEQPKVGFGVMVVCWEGEGGEKAARGGWMPNH